MELKMNQYQLPEAVSFNYEELKNELQEKVSMYQGLIYSDEQIQLAKKDKANLNKLKKALNDERIRLQKEYMIPFNEFKAKIDELISIIDKPVGLIDKQVKEFEEQKKSEKLEAIKEYWNRVVSKEHPLKFERVMDQKWLNASVSMKSIQEEINGILAKFAEDVATLQKLPEFAFEAVETYKSSLNLGKALNEAHRLSETAKRKAEAERQKAEAEAKKQEEQLEGQIGFTDAESFEKCMNPPEPERFWLGFKAHLTVADAQNLKLFFEERGIEFEQIAI